jgi:AraC-like DNA-binding protein
VSYESRRPAAPLRPYVRAYTGYRVTQPPGVHRGVPDGRMTFIVSLADDIRILQHVDPRQAPGAYGTVLGGLHVTPALIARGGPEEGIALDLTPLGTRALLGLPAGALAELTVEGEDVLGRGLVELRDRARHAASWADRFAVVDEILLRRLAADQTPDASLQAAWHLLAGGTSSVAAVAAELGWSRRHLGARFAGEFGVSPKAAARALRFGRAVGHLRAARGRVGLAGLAALAGYYDQSHLTREFHAMAGCTPSAWIAEEFPSVQDTAAPPGEDRPSRPGDDR